MQSYIEITAFAMNVKPFTYSKGTGYNFSFAMKGEAQSEDKNSAPVVWISGVSFNQPILDKRNYLLKGKLQVKPPYKDYPAGLQLVVSEAILLESGMYVVARKRSEPTTHENTTQAPKQVQDTQSHPNNAYSQGQPNQAPPTQPKQETYEAYRDPVKDITMPSEEVPF